MKRNRKKILICFAGFWVFMLAGYLISRGIYAAALPRVSLAKADNRSLFHTVKASGQLTQDADGGVYIPEGLAVKAVKVQPGDQVEEKDVLLVIEKASLTKKVEELELELSKLKLQEQTLSANRSQAEADRQTQITRMEKQKQDYGTWKSEQQAAKAEQQALADQVEELTRQVNELQKKLQEAKNAAAGKEQDSVSGGNASGNPAGNASGNSAIAKLQALLQEKQGQLEEALKAKTQAERRLQQLQEDAVSDPGYGVEDARHPLTADSSIEQLQLQEDALKKHLQEYEELLKAEGQIFAQESGIVSGIYVQSGALTGPQAAITLCSEESPVFFDVNFSAEQMKYLSRDMNITVFLDGQSRYKKQLTYLIESAAGDGSFLGRIAMERGEGMTGQRGSVEAVFQTETYDCCIPVEALYSDGNGRSFVYVQEKSEGFFGTELAARKLSVTVLDQNETYAAIEPGILNGDSEVILSSTKELSDGCIVRPE